MAGLGQGFRGANPYAAPAGYEQITSLSSAAGLTPVKHSVLAVISVEGQNVRYRDDGTNPTTGVGSILYVGDVLHYDGDMSTIKFIEITSGAKLNVHYYKG